MFNICLTNGDETRSHRNAIFAWTPRSEDMSRRSYKGMKWTLRLTNRNRKLKFIGRTCEERGFGKCDTQKDILKARSAKRISE